ncbi:MAG: polyprenyl synthetase family protein, partial [Bacillota bacterium]
TARAPESDMVHWRRFGEALGLGFQIQDDVLDLVGDEKKMGKKAGRDAKNNKVTYVTLLGLEGARHALRMEQQNMLAELAMLPIERGNIQQLVTMLMEREN